MITLGNYEYNPGDILGNGAFAIVYKGHFKANPANEVAIKRMLKDQNIIKSKTLLSKEIAVLKDLCHENIVRLYDHSISSTGVYLVMEYCNGGDLADYLQKLKTLSEDTIQNFLVQIGSAMDSMNHKGVIHRDLKPGNILLCYPKGNERTIADVSGADITFKLADFGFARFLQDGMMAATMCGSPMYMAPEILMCWKYDALADIWSMGIIVYQCLTGTAPWQAKTPDQLKNIYSKTPSLKPKIPSTTSPGLRDLLLRMLVRNPRDRIDFKSFLAHPFLTKKEGIVRSEPINMKRRCHSNFDIRVSTSGSRQRPGMTQRAPEYQTAPGAVADFHAVASVPDIPRYDPSGGLVAMGTYMIAGGYNRGGVVPGLKPLEDDEPPLEDFVIVNADGSEAIQPSRSTDPARKAFDFNPGSSEVLASLLGTCNTSPDYRRNLIAMATGGPTESPRRSSPLAVVRTSSAARIRPPSHPACMPYPRITRKLSENLDVQRSPATSPSQPKFFVGSGGRPPSYSSSSGAGTPNSPGAGFRWAAAGSSGSLRQLGPPPPPILEAGEAMQPVASEVNINAIAAFRPSSLLDGAGRQLTRERRSMTAPGEFNITGDSERLLRVAFGDSPKSQGRMTPSKDIDPALLMHPPELSDEVVMEPEHTEEVRKVTFVLELCELVTELCEQRSTPLSTVGPRRMEVSDDDATPRFASEPQRIVEQIVLYKRVLQYLEFVFYQVKNAFKNGKLKATRTARKRIKDCNATYHRCYIRLRYLARDCQRVDIMEQIAELKKAVTADKLIFQYALNQCSAAEMDEFEGDLDMSIRRYKAAITLLHGLNQHARTPIDKVQLSRYLALIQDRYSALWTATQHCVAHSPP